MRPAPPSAWTDAVFRAEESAADPHAMKIRWNIRLRLQVSALAVAGTVLCAVVGWGYFSGRAAIYRETREKALFLAEGAAGIFDGRMLREQGTVEGLAAALESDSLDLTLSSVKKLQDRVMRGDPEIFGVCVALDPSFSPPVPWADRAPYTFRAKDGSFCYRNLAADGAAYTSESWYDLPRQAGHTIWTVPYWWEGVLMVTFSCPLWVGEGEGRQFVGVATCDLTLDWLDRQLEKLPAGADGYAWLVNQDGLFLAHPQRDLVLKTTLFQMADRLGSRRLRETATRMVAGGSGVEEHVSVLTGRQSWLAYVPLRSANWFFAAVLSQEVLRARLYDLAWQQSAIAVGGLLLLLASLAWVARTITVPVERLRAAAHTLAEGDFQAPLPDPRGGDEVADLTRSFSTMRGHLVTQMRELAETSAARERMQSELRIAHDIQMGLVPKTFPPIPNLDDIDLFAHLGPAREVGGDFYDFFQLGPDELVVIIGDVSDKGVPAALYMAATRSFLRSFFRADAPHDPASVLGMLNRELVADNPSCMFVTIFCATLRFSDGRLRYANAGHNPPLLRLPDGTVEALDEPRGLVAGALDDARFETGERTLPPGTCLLLYTDGVTEATDAGLELFGEERLLETMAMAGEGTSCRQLIESILQRVDGFSGDAPVADDITLLAVKRLTSGPDWRWDVAGTPEDCAAALDNLEGWLAGHGADERLLYVARLALEELATNALKLSLPAGGSAHAEFSLKPPALSFEDSGPPFDPWSGARVPDTSAPIADREPGGLGLHLIRSLAAAVFYTHRDGSNFTRVEFDKNPKN